MNEYEALLPQVSGAGTHFYHESWKMKFKHFILHNGQGGNRTLRKSPRAPASHGLRSSHLHITEPKLASSSANIIDVSELTGNNLSYTENGPVIDQPSKPTVNPRSSSLYSSDSFQLPLDNHKWNATAFSTSTISEKTSQISPLTTVEFQQNINRRVSELENSLQAAKDEIWELKQTLQAEKETNSFLCQKIYDQHSVYSGEKLDFVQIVAEYKQAIRRLKHQRDIETSQTSSASESRPASSFSYSSKMATRRSQNGFPHTVPIQS